MPDLSVNLHTVRQTFKEKQSLDRSLFSPLEWLMKEEWKPVVGYESRYLVSNMGRLKSLNHKGKHISKVIPLCVSNMGYKTLNIRVKKESKRIFLHICVLEAFIGLRPKGLLACHYDDNKLNNKLTNLRWDTRKNNALDMIRNGKFPIGEKNRLAKLKEKDILNIYKLKAKNFTNQIIAEKFNLTTGGVYQITNGRSWKHLFNKSKVALI